MTIAKAENRDFEAIAGLDRVAWNQSACAEFIPDGEHAWRLWCEHALVFAAKTDDRKVVGVVLAFPCLNGSLCLHKIIVAESHRGQGISGKLLGALFVALDEMDADCFLTVDPSNTTALELYKRHGFTRSEFFKGFYRETEDRFVLTRPRGNQAD